MAWWDDVSDWVGDLFGGGGDDKPAPSSRPSSRPAPPSSPTLQGAKQWNPEPRFDPSPQVSWPGEASPRPAGQEPAGSWLDELMASWNRTSQQQMAANAVVGSGGDPETAKQQQQRVLDLSAEGSRKASQERELRTSAVDTERQSEGARHRALVQDAGSFETKQLTAKEYGDLSVRQRAAVDFNTQLVDAVAADQKLGQTDSEVENKEYDETLKRMFGERGGSSTYAPNTVALLSQIDFKDSAADLDQFLGLQASVTEQDLGRLTDKGDRLQAGVPSEGRSIRGDNAVALSDKTATALSSVLAKGQSLLDAMAPTATSFGATGGSASVDEALSGANTPTTGVGFGAGEADLVVQRMYDELAKVKPQKPISETDLADSFTLLQEKFGVTPDDFFNYADSRVRSAEYGQLSDKRVTIGTDPGADYKSPDQFRTEFGL